MKFNKYQLAAGAVLVIILIVVFVQRSDWDSNKYILSADDAGNLTPLSEKYFDDNEKKHTQKLVDEVNELIAFLNPVYVKPVAGPNVFWRGQHLTHANDGHMKRHLDAGGLCADLIGHGDYQCPKGALPVGKGLGNGRCGCVAFKGR